VQGTDGEAVALNNLAVLTFETADNDLQRIDEAEMLIQKSVDTLQVWTATQCSTVGGGVSLFPSAGTLLLAH
jgi:hypothetical protein